MNSILIIITSSQPSQYYFCAHGLTPDIFTGLGAPSA